MRSILKAGLTVASEGTVARIVSMAVVRFVFVPFAHKLFWLVFRFSYSALN